MLNKWLRFAVLGASALALAACGAQGNTGAGDMTQNGYRTHATGAGQTGTGMRGNNGIHQNRNVTINQDIARAIERLDGITRANVAVGETNAYVAVELNEGALNNAALGGSHARMSGSAAEFGIRGNYYGATDSRAFPSVRGQSGIARGTAGLNDVGTGRHAPGMYGYNRATTYSNFGLGGEGTGQNGTGQSGAGQSGTVQRGTGQSGMGQSGTGQSGSKQIGTKQSGAGQDRTKGSRQHAGRSGRVGLNDTGMNGPRDDAESRYMHNGGAYGAYNTANDGLSLMVQARIESIVRAMAPSVRNVYVSADPSLMQRMGTYQVRSNGSRTARTGVDWVNEFNAFVGRLFGNDDATNRYDMNGGYDQRNRNGVTQQMNNSFDQDNPRHRTGGLGANAQAGTIGSTR